MAITPELILAVRYELGDVDISLPMISDEEYTYYLTKHSESVTRAAVDAAKALLFRLSIRNDYVIDVLSVKGSKAAQAYKEALQLYIKNPDLNGLLRTVSGYIGGTSKADILSNNNTVDNKAVFPPVKDPDNALNGSVDSYPYTGASNPFYTP